jgi:predicted amidohydrolase
VAKASRSGTCIAVVNMDVTHDKRQNIQTILRLMEEAAHEDADVLVLPEACLQGYADFAFPLGSDGSVRQRRFFLEAAEPIDGPSLSQVADKCQELDLIVQLGFTECDASRAALYNSVAIIGPSGTMAVYRKCHNSFEFPYFAPGPALSAPVQAGAARVGSLICYDLAFPETMRVLALNGCDVALMSTAWPMGGHDRTSDYCGSRLDLCARANAFFNQMWLAISDHCESNAYSTSLDYYGGAQIVDPRGEVVAAVGDGEGMAFCTADIEATTIRARTQDFYGLTLLQDRRPDLYSRITETS